MFRRDWENLLLDTPLLPLAASYSFSLIRAAWFSTTISVLPPLVFYFSPLYNKVSHCFTSQTKRLKIQKTWTMNVAIYKKRFWKSCSWWLFIILERIYFCSVGAERGRLAISILISFSSSSKRLTKQLAVATQSKTHILFRFNLWNLHRCKKNRFTVTSPPLILWPAHGAITERKWKRPSLSFPGATTNMKPLN